jgi:pimeloyl-ACP methyl ester carboxylesterase
VTDTTVVTRSFAGRDGAPLVYHEVGDGRPLVLLHGLFSNAAVNWIRPGHAAALAARGMRVVMPDLRAHGASARSHDTAAYPLDVLVDDGLALLDALGVDDYDLGGYSLGARTAVAAGVGFDAVVRATERGTHFRHLLANLGAFARGTPEWAEEAFLRKTGGDPAALALLLDSFVDTPPTDLARIGTPVLVVAGADDHDHGDPDALAAVLPHATRAVVPGNHMSAVTTPRLTDAIADFLAVPAGLHWRPS